MKKTVLITGASKGIGKEFARLYAIDNCQLILTGRDEKSLNDLKSELSKDQLNNGQKNEMQIRTIALDLSQPGAGQKLFELCKKDNVDVLINNAGFGLYGNLDSLPEDEIEKMIHLNIVSLTLLTKLFGGQMKEKKSGEILNVASVAAYQPLPGLAAYAASKSYVLHFSEALAAELAPCGVTVSCLSPGATKTEFFQRAGIRDQDSGFFSVKNRASAAGVARYGKSLLRKKKISGIPGMMNYIMAFSNRLAPRAMVVKISGAMMSKG